MTQDNDIDWKDECFHALELARKASVQADKWERLYQEQFNSGRTLRDAIQDQSNDIDALKLDLEAEKNRVAFEASKLKESEKKRDEAVELAVDAVNLARTCWRLSTSPNNAACNALESRLSALTKPKEGKK
jgi:hypothetical protein